MKLLLALIVLSIIANTQPTQAEDKKSNNDKANADIETELDSEFDDSHSDELKPAKPSDFEVPEFIKKKKVEPEEKHTLVFGFSPLPQVFYQGVATGKIGGDLYQSASQDRLYGGKFGLSIEYRDSAKNDWGFLAGYHYFDKALLLSERSDLDSPQQSSESPSSLKLDLIYIGAIYRWTNIYVPFGITAGSAQYKAPTGQTGSAQAQPSYFTGIGLFFSPQVSLEYMYLTLEGLVEITQGSESEKFKGKLTGSSFLIKYHY